MGQFSALLDNPIQGLLGVGNVWQQSFPLSYYRSTKTSPAYIVATPTFTCSNSSVTKFVLKGQGDGYSFGPIAGSVSNGSLTATMNSNQPISLAIDSSTLSITWSISLDGGKTFSYVGASDNHLFVTGGHASTEPETVLWLGCEGAKGKVPGSDSADGLTPDQLTTAKTLNQQVVDGVWSEFAGDDVKDVEGNPLLYWGSFATNSTSGALTSLGDTGYYFLLQYKDGRCGSWASLLVATLKAEGITSHIVVITPNVLHRPQKTGLSAAAGSEFTIYASDHPQNYGISHTTTVTFSNHAVVRIDSPVFHQFAIYDPSYGGNPYDGITRQDAENAWEKAAIQTLDWHYLNQNNDLVVDPQPDPHDPTNPWLQFTDTSN